MEAARASGAAGPAAEAVELYRGELLPDDVYEPWTEERARPPPARRTCEMLHLLGRWDTIVAADPLDEVAHLQLVQDARRAG